MKKIILSFSVGVFFLTYLVYQRMGLSPSSLPIQTSLNPSPESGSSIAVSDSPKENTLPITTDTPPTKSTDAILVQPKDSSSANSTSPKSVAAPIPVPVPTPAPAKSQPTGMYKDGTYQGSRSNAYYGYIQVGAVIRGGKLTDVQFLEYPNDRQRSVSINTQALPYLKSEAIQAQNAQVDTISGASDTSQAFRESLTSALLQAKA